MTFTWDFNTATLVAIAVQAILAIVFFVRLDGKAKMAVDKATEARGHADAAHERVAVLTGLLSLHREHVAKEYIDKGALREMEVRLNNSIVRLSDRIDEVLDRGRN